MRKILVIAPHADDEILGCGATMAKAVTSGDEVYVLICTNASVGAPELFTEEMVNATRKEAIAAHAFIGVKKTLFLELPAPALDFYPSYKIANQIVQVIRELSIDTVYVPHRGDCHKDHRVIHDAAMVACRPLGSSTVKRVYSYETLSETEWGEPIASEYFIPTKFNVFSEKEFQVKIDTMGFFKSQLYPFPASRSLEAIESLAKYRGAGVSAVRAEAFMLLREIE